jgi:hypothetical protein
MRLTTFIITFSAQTQVSQFYLPGKSSNDYVNGPRFRWRWNLYLCSDATWVVFLFPKAIMNLDCIVKHLICTLVVDNCFLILSVVTCSPFSIQQPSKWEGGTSMILQHLERFQLYGLT